MEIYLKQPAGFCPGVKKALARTFEIIEAHPSANIYLIGNVVHNDEVCAKIDSLKNVKVINDSRDRLSQVKSIKSGKNTIVIFSAHGTDPRAVDYAQTKGWKVYDFTCPFVWIILSTIRRAILHGYHVAYFGEANHPEAIAAKKVGGDNLTVYRTKKDLKEVLNKPYVHVMCQSSMNWQEFEDTKKWFSPAARLKFNNFVCNTSRKRQEEAYMCKHYDIVFVLTSPRSHNGLSLYEALKKKNLTVKLIDPLKMNVTKKMIANKKDCAIFTSASVSQDQIDKFIKKLKSL